jgi:hypothetical protein
MRVETMESFMLDAYVTWAGCVWDTTGGGIEIWRISSNAVDGDTSLFNL